MDVWNPEHLPGNILTWRHGINLAVAHLREPDRVDVDVLSLIGIDCFEGLNSISNVEVRCRKCRRNSTCVHAMSLNLVKPNPHGRNPPTVPEKNLSLPCSESPGCLYQRSQSFELFGDERQEKTE